MNNTISALYGQNDDEEAKGPKQRLVEASAKDDFEIRTQGKNFAHIKVGKETIDVPRARYVKDLESTVEKLDKELKKAQATIRQLTTAARNAERDIRELKAEMKTKLDRFD